MIDFDSTIAKSFNQDFCHALEFHLTRAFANNSSNKFERIWCDGIMEPEAWRQDLDNFYKIKEIVTYGWLGLTGQDKYWVIIKLGDLSFERCLQGFSMDECLPDDQTLDWVNLDEQNWKIVLQLL